MNAALPSAAPTAAPAGRTHTLMRLRPSLVRDLLAEAGVREALLQAAREGRPTVTLRTPTGTTLVVAVTAFVPDAPGNRRARRAAARGRR